MKRNVHLTTLLSFALAACASNPAPVNLTADPAGMQLLAGKWSGNYTNRESGRTGSIVFTLIAGEDHAHGDVLMIPVGYDRPLEAYQEAAAAANQAPRVLTIDFVSATGNRVTGTLAPYRDPACGCPLATTFDGEIKGNRIAGKFQSYHAVTGERQSGEWQVDRKKPR